MANYQSITISLAPADGDCTKPMVIPGAGTGTRIIAFALIVFPNIYLDGDGSSRVSMRIGSEGRPFRLRAGMTWTASLGRDLLPIPETGGLFLVGDAGMASIKGFEFVIEFEPQENR